MKARFSKLTLVTVALLTLTACSQSQSTSSKSSAKEETKQTQTKSSKETSSAKDTSKETGKEESSKAGKSDVKVDSGNIVVFVATIPKLDSIKTMSIKMVRKPQIVIPQDRAIVNTKLV